MVGLADVVGGRRKFRSGRTSVAVCGKHETGIEEGRCGRRTEECCGCGVDGGAAKGKQGS